MGLAPSQAIIGPQILPFRLFFGYTPQNDEAASITYSKTQCDFFKDVPKSGSCVCGSKKPPIEWLIKHLPRSTFKNARNIQKLCRAQLVCPPILIPLTWASETA